MSTGYLVTIRKGWNGNEEILNSNFANGARLSSAVISKSVTVSPLPLIHHTLGTQKSNPIKIS